MIHFRPFRRNDRSIFRFLASLIAMIVLTSSVSGQDVTKETVLDGLFNPCAVAIQPTTGHVFVADSGHLKVIRVVDGKPQDVIVDFPKDVYGKDSTFDIGPLGLAFLDKDTLVVGGGGKPDGDELLRVYKIPAAGAEPIKADEKMDASFALAADGETVGEGNFYGVQKTEVGVYVTCNGDDVKGWIARADLKGGKLENFRRYIPSKEKTKVDAPVGITFSPEGFLTVSQMGEITDAADSLLTFYSEDGKLLDQFSTGLYDISGLAYGPKRKRLFCIDFSWADTTKGGLFKLIAAGNDSGCESIKITDLDKPTAMAFDPAGNLYVTVCGTVQDGSDTKPGKLLVIKGLDKAPKKTGE